MSAFKLIVWLVNLRRGSEWTSLGDGIGADASHAHLGGKARQIDILSISFYRRAWREILYQPA
ncbi:hypothetical protein, partial [Escherichia coli]|uniref:hypothetical protein n=1 Tax=Escherichia coli TaxID=562 RepID=UPI0015C4B43C